MEKKMKGVTGEVGIHSKKTGADFETRPLAGTGQKPSGVDCRKPQALFYRQFRYSFRIFVNEHEILAEPR
jgi:hypothetical protein